MPRKKITADAIIKEIRSNYPTVYYLNVDFKTLCYGEEVNHRMMITSSWQPGTVDVLKIKIEKMSKIELKKLLFALSNYDFMAYEKDIKIIEHKLYISNTNAEESEDAA